MALGDYIPQYLNPGSGSPQAQFAAHQRLMSGTDPVSIAYQNAPISTERAALYRGGFGQPIANTGIEQIQQQTAQTGRIGGGGIGGTPNYLNGPSQAALPPGPQVAGQLPGATPVGELNMPAATPMGMGQGPFLSPQAMPQQGLSFTQPMSQAELQAAMANPVARSPISAAANPSGFYSNLGGGATASNFEQASPLSNAAQAFSRGGTAGAPAAEAAAPFTAENLFANSLGNAVSSGLPEGAVNPSLAGVNLGRRAGVASEDFLAQSFKSPQTFAKALEGEGIGTPGISNLMKGKQLAGAAGEAIGPEGWQAGVTGAEGVAALEGASAGGLRGALGIAAPAVGIATAPFAGPPVANLVAGNAPVESPRGFLSDVAGSAAVGGLAGAGGGALIGGIGALPGAAIGAIGGGIVGGVEHLFGKGLTANDQERQGPVTPPTPQGQLNSMFDASRMPQGQKDFVQSLYNEAVAADGSDQGKQTALRAAQQAIGGFMQQNYQTQAQQQDRFQQAASLQALTGSIMGPINQQIASQNQMYAGMMNNLIPHMPANFQGIMQQGVNDQVNGSNTLAQAYTAQALASPQMQQLALQQQANQQTYDIYNRANTYAAIDANGNPVSTATNGAPNTGTIGAYPGSALPNLPNVGSVGTVSLPKG